ncbi:hypothetical protein EZJ58_1067 [Sodalis ligni]|uniref:Uncharacterized protein n=1 Tax=Sodalis ligni TaxID=2697027 RepID=A0A4R1NEH2_9GAMM|nr:hypothetical protein EZJ58_1067 [Sodalis ligni]
MQFELNDIVPGRDRMPDRINTVSPAVNPSMEARSARLRLPSLVAALRANA